MWDSYLSIFCYCHPTPLFQTAVEKETVDIPEVNNAFPKTIREFIIVSNQF